MICLSRPIPAICLALLIALFLNPPKARGTPVVATGLASFEGREEPTVLYHPSTATFTDDSYVNMTDQGGGVMRFTLRYHPEQDWWDGDRATTNIDRQRAEVKGLGPHQNPGDMFEYSFDFRTDSSFVGGSGFDHIFQLKPLDGDLDSPMIVVDPGKGSGSSGSVRLWTSADAHSVSVRSLIWAPDTWEHVVVRITTSTSTSGASSDGAVVASINGDAFQGVRNVPVYRTGSTDFRPKWGFYRGISSDLRIGEDYVEQRNVMAEQLLSGDANRDGHVDTVDFNLLAANFGGGGKIWQQGDFNADGVVDTLDFNLLAAKFGQSLTAPLLVPEPRYAAQVMLSMLILLSRKQPCFRLDKSEPH
jgi:hypothetical protein